MEFSFKTTTNKRQIYNYYIRHNWEAKTNGETTHKTKARQRNSVIQFNLIGSNNRRRSKSSHDGMMGWWVKAPSGGLGRNCPWCRDTVIAVLMFDTWIREHFDQMHVLMTFYDTTRHKSAENVKKCEYHILFHHQYIYIYEYGSVMEYMFSYFSIHNSIKYYISP